MLYSSSDKWHLPIPPLSAKSDKSILVDRQNLLLLEVCCVLFQFWFVSMFFVSPSLRIYLNQAVTPWNMEDIYSTCNLFFFSFVACKRITFHPGLSQISSNKNCCPSPTPALLRPQCWWPQTQSVASVEPASKLQDCFCCFQLDSSPAKCVLVKNHRIIEYLKLEGTHEDHWTFQLSAPHRTTQK